MELASVATERTTAATDAVLAVAALAAILLLRRTTGPSFGRAVRRGPPKPRHTMYPPMNTRNSGRRSRALIVM